MAKTTWTVKGKIAVAHQLAELIDKFDGESPLKGIEVKISAKAKVPIIGWGTWNSWGTVRTNSKGEFSISKSKNHDLRRFKIEVKFQDDDLAVRHEHATSSLTKVKWYTIIEESSKEHKAGTVDFNQRTFKSGGKHDRGDFEARRHADIWVLYQMVIDHVAAMGSDFAFTTQVKVKYPHNGITGDAVEAPYANPTTKVIYIVKNSRGDYFNTDTLLHELGHIYAYNHVSGEICLTEGLLMDGSTHGLVDDHCVAFHEGFAQYWSDKLREELFGA
jgi:hypothetical protein